NVGEDELLALGDGRRRLLDPDDIARRDLQLFSARAENDVHGPPEAESRMIAIGGGKSSRPSLCRPSGDVVILSEAKDLLSSRGLREQILLPCGPQIDRGGLQSSVTSSGNSLTSLP